jgi:hypothetical protein
VLVDDRNSAPVAKRVIICEHGHPLVSALWPFPEMLHAIQAVVYDTHNMAAELHLHNVILIRA